MKRIFMAFALTLFVSTLTFAQIYKCVDEDGNVRYTTTPGPDCTLLNGSVQQNDSTRKPVKQSTQPTSTTIKTQTNPISVIPRSKAKADLKSKLSQRYKGKYSTQKMLLDGGLDAYGKLCLLPATKINNQILSRLRSRYYPSFSTILMLYESEIKAYRELQKQ